MRRNPYQKRAKELEKALDSIRTRIDLVLGDEDDHEEDEDDE